MILEEDPEGILFPIFLLWLLLKKGNFFSPASEMAFLVRCYANCLQPWASKVSKILSVLHLSGMYRQRGAV